MHYIIRRASRDSSASQSEPPPADMICVTRTPGERGRVSVGVWVSTIDMHARMLSTNTVTLSLTYTCVEIKHLGDGLEVAWRGVSAGIAE